MANLTDDVLAQVENLRQRAGEFAATFDQFQSVRNYLVNNPALMAEWENANTYANSVKSTVSWINGQVDGAVNWLSRTFGFSGIRSMNLGAVPLISAAYLVASTAALVYATDWMIQIIEKANIEKQKIALVESGAASENILMTPQDSSIFGNVLGDTSNLLKWLIIGGAAWYFLPKLIKDFEK